MPRRATLVLADATDHAALRLTLTALWQRHGSFRHPVHWLWVGGGNLPAVPGQWVARFQLTAVPGPGEPPVTAPAARDVPWIRPAHDPAARQRKVKPPAGGGQRIPENGFAQVIRNHQVTPWLCASFSPTT